MAAGEVDAVRDRGDARPPGREGLPDHRPGDRRHRHAARPRPGLDRLDDEAGLHRQALVLAGRHRARRPQAARRPAAGSTRTSSFPRARSSSPTRAIPSRCRCSATSPRATAAPRSGARSRSRSSRAAASGSARPSTRRFPTARSRSRSSTPFSTTRRERAAMAVLTELLVEAQVSIRGEPPAGLPGRAEHDRRRSTARRFSGSARTSGSCSAAAKRTIRRRRPRSTSRPTASSSSWRATTPSDVLAQGCSLDLHPSVFAPGSLRADAARARPGDPRPPATRARFLVLVRPSFAPYLRAWLEDAIEGATSLRSSR